MSTAHSTPPRFQAGDWVTFLFGPRRAYAQILEDRGPLGAHRQHIYRIVLRDQETGDDAFELPEHLLQPASKLEPRQIVEYLSRGGLVHILHANLSGGHDQPRAWLAISPRGEVIHTFSKEQGMLGGHTVPFWALHENKVFSPKVEEVLEFLKSFRLSDVEARHVIKAVGTAP